MADKGLIASFVNALPDQLRMPIKSAFDYVMDDWKVGTERRAINAQWYRVTSTTSSVANQEFSVTHGLESIPTQFWQIADLSQVNSQIVPLTVSRAADATRIYLKSSSTSAVFVMMVEV